MLLSAIAAVAVGQADAGLLRFPDIYGENVVFVYAGDLWAVSAAGGAARKLTNSPGAESFPKYSPDGNWIAFTANYDGNSDVYVMPSEGGEPKRLTYHPAGDAVLDWTPDGKNIIFRSVRNSPSQRYQGAFSVPAAGGTAVALPMTECGLASASPDGTTFAYNRMPTENAAWKRYRGGLQSWISFYDVKNNKYWEMPHDKSAYLWPMWVDNRVFYANDADGRYNLYAYDTKNKQSKKLTNYADYDVKWPSYGSGKIVFERNARLWLYDIADGKASPIPVRLNTDLVDARPIRMELGDRIGDFSLSPSGARLAVEARGEMFSVPVKEGLTYNMSKSSGVRERYPRWSPDGKTILFASDKTGEYEFYVQKSDLSAAPVAVTSGSSRFYNNPVWSPDSKKFFVTDAGSKLYVVDVDSKAKKLVGKADFSSYGDCVWSPDSKYLAYSKADSAGFSDIYVYDVGMDMEIRLTDNIYDDTNPVFDADMKYLYFVSTRDVNPSIGLFELAFSFENGQRIYGMTLDKDSMSPFAPKNDEEKAGDAKPADAKPAPKTDWIGIEGRMFNIPVAPGQYGLVAAPSGRILYVAGGSLFSFGLNEKRADRLLESFGGLDFTPKFDKMAYLAGGGLFVVPVGPAAPGAGRVSTADVEAVTEPKAEWKQSYWEAWRYERDYYWAPNMNGMDWKAIGDKYAAWLPYLGHRVDLDYLLRELLGELSTGHSYVIPGPVPGVRPVAIGLLGADYERAADGVRFKKVFRGQNWEGARRAPLNEPGMNVKDGDYILAIDGERVNANTNVEELLVGKADKVVEVTIGPTASMTGSRKLLVRPIGDENSLRYADFLESKMKYVTEKTGGRVGYVYVPSTGMDGVIEFHKMFYPQVDKDAMIVDERWNSGGFIPDFFVEKLGRTPLMWWTPRDQGDFRSPGQAVLGPKVMLINHYGGSGGDAFPYFFKRKKIGPLIGTRTWGGLVGITGNRDLMAGGAVTVPQFASWDVDEKGNSKWVVENVGVSPDIEIDNAPDAVWAGKDPQLDKAIEVILDMLKKNPVKRPTKPAYYGSGGR